MGRQRIYTTGPPTVAEIRASREGLRAIEAWRPSEELHRAIAVLSQMLFALESGKFVIVPQMHFAELDRLREKLEIAEDALRRR